jgi:hypothetical protein
VKRIRIGWGEEGRNGVAARNEAIATADDREQPRRGLGESASERLARARRSESRTFSDASPSIEMGRVERSSKLERIRGKRLLSEELDQRFKQPPLEYLSILHSQSAKKCWIADANTGEVFLNQAFATPQHSHEAAAELERTFDMSEVLKLRPPETLERMGELAREHWLREQVAGMLG